MPKIVPALTPPLDNLRRMAVVKWSNLYYICSDESYTYWTSDVKKAAMFLNLVSLTTTIRSLR